MSPETNTEPAPVDASSIETAPPQDKAQVLAQSWPPEHRALAALLIDTGLHSEDQGERERAVAALAQLPEMPSPEEPNLPNWDAPTYSLMRQVGRAEVLLCALVELGRLAAPFQDAELDEKLRWATGRCTEHLMTRRRALKALKAGGRRAR